MGMIAAHCHGIVREFQSVWRLVTLCVCYCVLRMSCIFTTCHLDNVLPLSHFTSAASSDSPAGKRTPRFSPFFPEHILACVDAVFSWLLIDCVYDEIGCV